MREGERGRERERGREGGREGGREWRVYLRVLVQRDWSELRV